MYDGHVMEANSFTLRSDSLSWSDVQQEWTKKKALAGSSEGPANVRVIEALPACLVTIRVFWLRRQGLQHF